jgi:hypothetical protein
VNPEPIGEPVGLQAAAVSMYQFAELNPVVDDKLNVTESPSQIIVFEFETVIVGFVGTTTTCPKE